MLPPSFNALAFFAASLGYVQRKKCIVGKQLSEIGPGPKDARPQVSHENTQVLFSPFFFSLFTAPQRVYIHNPLRRAEIKSTLKYQYEADER